MTELIIRSAREEDAPKLTDLVQQLGYSHTTGSIKACINAYINQPNHQAWVALLDNTTVGCITVFLCECLYYNHRFATVNALITDKKCRGQGIGDTLLKYAENYAQQQNCHYIELMTHVKRAILGVHQFYDKRGYKDLNTDFKFMRKMLRGETFDQPSIGD